MKSLCVISVTLLLAFNAPASASRPSGFFMPDSVQEITMAYTMVKGLIVLPVTINDSIRVNLILDTGCSNLVLFGRRFKRLFDFPIAKPVVFSGLGSGKRLTGRLAMHNKVSIDEITGELMPIIVVDESNLFSRYKDIHGVLGYDIFLRFEIELNPRSKTITFRKANHAPIPVGYTIVPMEVVDARPVIKSSVLIYGQHHSFDLMIDTGSELGLLVKTTRPESFHLRGAETAIGIGLNGPLMGHSLVAKEVRLPGLYLPSVPTGIVESPWHNNATLGMEVLRHYIVIINYCKSYVGFRMIDA